MTGNRIWDRVFSTASWLIVIGLLYGAVAATVIPPVSLSGPIVELLGLTGARIFYGALYGTLGGLLGYSKLFKKKNLRRYTLLAVYLTGFFTTILITALSGGFVPGVIDNLLMAILAAACWIHWTFKTRYIDPEVFQTEIRPMRNDLPPFP